MKKNLTVFFVIVAILVFFMLYCNGIKVFAEESDLLDENVKKTYDSLSFEAFTDAFFDCLKEILVPSFPIFVTLIGMLLITAVINAFEINFEKFDVGAYVSSICFSGFLFGVIKNLCEQLAYYIEKIKSISAVFVPPLISANLADGGLTAKTNYTGAVIAVSVIEFLVSSVVLPCVKLLFVLMILSSVVGKTVDLRGFSNSLRTFSIMSTALLMTAVVTVIHFQNVVARSSDGITNRVVRFAATNLVPIVGNLLGESVKTVAESMKAVGAITGAAGIAAVLSAALPPLIACLVFKIEINICVCIAKTLGCTHEASILSDTGGILNVLNGGLIVSTVGFSLMLCMIAHII